MNITLIQLNDYNYQDPLVDCLKQYLDITCFCNPFNTFSAKLRLQE